MAETMVEVPAIPGSNGTNGAPDTKAPAKKAGTVRVEFQNSKFQMHPDVEALQVPRQTSSEYAELRDNIEKTGKIREKIKMAREPMTKAEFVVDGWHRIHIADELGFKLGEQYQFEWVPWDEALDIAVSSQLRRNLTENQRLAIASRLVEVEKEKSKQRQATNARMQNIIRSSQAPETIETDYERLDKGGDIAATFSADGIRTNSVSANSKIRGTFEFDGKQYVAVDGQLGKQFLCYEFVDLKTFKAAGGTLSNYVTRSNEWAQGKNTGVYDGIMCEMKTSDEGIIVGVLQGPALMFEPTEKSREIAEAVAKAEAKAKGKKGKTAKEGGKTSEKVSAQMGGQVSPRTIEMLEAVKKADPEAYQRVIKEEFQPGTELLETVNSAYARVKATQKAQEAATGVKDPAKQTGHPSPESMTMDDFVAGHPLYAELKEDPIFIDAVKAWVHMHKQIYNVKMQASKTPVLRSKNRDQFHVAINRVAVMPHPYDWSRAEDKPGGFSISPVKKVKPEAPKADAPTEASADAPETDNAADANADVANDLANE
jgi:hypothetical protein